MSHLLAGCCGLALGGAIALAALGSWLAMSAFALAAIVAGVWAHIEHKAELAVAAYASRLEPTLRRVK